MLLSQTPRHGKRSRTIFQADGSEH